MTERVQEDTVETSYLEMSDEEMMNAPAPSETKMEVVEEVADTDREQASTETQEETDDAEITEEAESVEETASKEQEKVETKEVTAEVVETKQEEVAKLDYEAEYKRLLTPFKANGREIAVNSVDDAIQLMQMGANYGKKMAGLKPNLKLMKLLENNGLLSEEKLSYLIDLDKKNPDAISKLVKDSGLDPMDLDADKASAYKQTTYTVDEREIELDTVLDDIQGTPTYNRTLDVVSNKWDGASKQVIAGSPQLLKVINEHMQTGVYDLIAKEMDSERMFGRLNGLSDIEAYRQIGDAIQARGGFNHLGNTQGQPPAKPVIVQPKPKQEDDDKLKERRRAASSTKPAASSGLAKDFNPLALSDEDFSKLANTQYS